MSPRTVLQPGVGDPCNLFVYVHLAAPADVRQHVAETTSAAVVFELWGNGTSAYKPMLPAYGGSWPAMVKGIGDKIQKRFAKTCLTTWSAGSQAVKDVLVAAKGDLTKAPDAIVMMDGLYGAKPPGSKPGDGKVAPEPGLTALAAYAAAAARGEGPICVIFHSNIYTDYASSKECAEAVQKLVEETVGAPMVADTSLTPAMLDKHAFKEALVIGNFHLVEFAGRDAQEHMIQAHLYDEVWKLWVPWTTGDAPKPEPKLPPVSKGSLAQVALAVALEECNAGVGETPPGSNKVKPEYWAGCTRMDPKTGKEVLIKMLVGPWCAVGFQWCSYEAARRLGYSAADWESWMTGVVPHGRRVSVIELQTDFTRRGLFHSAADVRAAKYDPQPGDAVFLDRTGANAAAGLGHIARFVRRIDATTFETVGGNEAGTTDSDFGDKWRKKTRTYADKNIRGFGAFPAPSQVQVPVPEAAALAVAPGLDFQIYEAIDRQYEEWLRGRKAAERQA